MSDGRQQGWWARWWWAVAFGGVAVVGGATAAALVLRRRRRFYSALPIHMPGGVGVCPYCSGEVVCELPPSICTPQDALAKVFPRIRRATRESIWVFYLNPRNSITGGKEVSRGGVAAVSALPRELFEGAIRRKATAILMVHNHPSGTPSPSPDDDLMTQRTKQAGIILGIPLLDHIVVGRGGAFVSYRNEGKI